MNKVVLYTMFDPDNSKESNLEGIRSRMWNSLRPLRFSSWTHKFNSGIEDYELDMVSTLSVLVNNEPNLKRTD